MKRAKTEEVLNDKGLKPEGSGSIKKRITYSCPKKQCRSFKRQSAFSVSNENRTKNYEFYHELSFKLPVSGKTSLDYQVSIKQTP